MNKSLMEIYVCPISKSPLTLEPASEQTQDIIAGSLSSLSKAGEELSYELKDGVPHFISSGQLSPIELETKHQYEEYYTEEFYDNIMDWLFESFHENEEVVREKMVRALELKPDSRVLEIGCGTGCDSFRIARQLNEQGVLFLQDLSGAMVSITKSRLERDYEKLKLSCELNYFVSTARNLPFPDKYFDAIFHFGGFNNFEDPKGTLAEFSRIVKEGGKIVIGDESVPPWLENTTFGEIVCNNNPLFKYKTPLQHLPECARDVNVTWLLGNCFYLIDFRVGDGPPPLNLDLEHKGRRGGTMRTRFYGQLEGVSLEAKKLAQEAALKEGISLHAWLDKLVRQAAVNGKS